MPTHYPSPAVRGLHPDAQLARAHAAFREIRSEAEAETRARQIAALPTVIWKGRTLYTIRCEGTTGKGPHVVNVPASLLWTLISLEHFRCTFH